MGLILQRESVPKRRGAKIKQKEQAMLLWILLESLEKFSN